VRPVPAPWSPSRRFLNPWSRSLHGSFRKRSTVA